ncbi:MAG: Omp28-related outer membrane protein [Leptolyngbya sp. SIO3F4]|nr:Omp28-related outer membrane protein [Leptolyngbya sp. SIO3F4]
MKLPVFALAALFLTMTACNQDDEGDDSPNPQPIDNGGMTSDSFYVEPTMTQEVFAGIMTRTSCGFCGQHGHPNFDRALREQADLNGVSFHYSQSDDLATQEGLDFVQFIGLRGTPSYTEDLTNFSSDHGGWLNSIGAARNRELQAVIGMYGKKMDESTFRIEVETEFVKAISGNVNLAVYYTENNVVHGQQDYGANPTFVENYIHNHTLRGSVSGIWGVSLVESPSAGQKEMRQYNVKLPAGVNGEYVWYVAVLYEVNGNGDPIRVINSQTLKR